MNMDAIKQPPHSLESEQAALSAILDDNRVFHTINGIITADDFYRHHHRTIYRRMDALALQHKPLDAVSLIDSLESAGDLEEAGGADYVVDLVTQGRGSANALHYALTIRDKRILRKLIEIGNDIAQAGYEPGELSEKLDEAQRKVMSLEIRKANDPRHIGDVLRDTAFQIDAAAKAKDGMTGISTGFADLDSRMAGMKPEDFIVVAGRPSMGKSVFAMNIAENVAIQGKTVMVFSLEMSSEQLAMRSLASTGRYSFDSIRKGSGVDGMWEAVTAGVSKLKDKSLYLDDNATITSQQLASRARKLSQKIGKPIDLIIVDYLQLLNDKGDGTERITRMSRALKLTAKDLKCPIVCLSQLNRSCEQRNDKRPQMSDLRESGAIEQDADAVIMLYRDEVYNENTNQKGVAEAIVRKLRNGPIGTVYLASRLDQMRFDNIAHGYTPPPQQPTKGRSFAHLDD